MGEAIARELVSLTVALATVKHNRLDPPDMLRGMGRQLWWEVAVRRAAWRSGPLRWGTSAHAPRCDVGDDGDHVPRGSMLLGELLRSRRPGAAQASSSWRRLTLGNRAARTIDQVAGLCVGVLGMGDLAVSAIAGHGCWPTAYLVGCWTTHLERRASFTRERLGGWRIAHSLVVSTPGMVAAHLRRRESRRASPPASMAQGAVAAEYVAGGQFQCFCCPFVTGGV